MQKFLRILLPVFPGNLKEIYFTGYVCAAEQYTFTIYITKFSTSSEILINKKHAKMIYGYYGDCLPKKFNRFLNYLVLRQTRSPQIKQLVIDGNEINSTKSCIVMLYDYDKIRDSETISHTTDYFSKLQGLIQDDNGHSKNNTIYTPAIINPQWLVSSMFLQHIFNYLNLVNWLINTIKRDKKVSIKQGNLILSIITDIILGYIVLQLISQDTKEISSLLMGMLEKLINLLYSLLKWLMGAPVGLKLNNAFNKMLGKYFSYHVHLWWLFLDVSGEKLDIILHIYRYMGYVGITFQTAVISDMICVATFHSYCIYVYAARLFNIQICGLIALLRLFVGRKYNPLRDGIDSCEYTNQELFVGTVAFTILLLLLPTTALYYIVFTLFRILSLSVQYILAKLIYMIQTLPLYVISLWLAQSPKVAGNILVEVENSDVPSPLVLRVKLFSKSVYELINNSKPPVQVPKQVEWTNLLSNILVGKQIV